MRAILLSAILVASTPVMAAAATNSVLLSAPDDPRAVTVKGVGDGRADDTEAVQKAIDAARDKTGHGLVFLPSGRYRLSRTILVPPGVRIFGVGATRPVFVLGANTPGFQKGVATMIAFTGGDQYQVGDIPVPVPTVRPETLKVRDANSGTFYSSIGNVDVEIGDGNPAAAAVRFRMAQHAFLSHMDFRLGSAFAGVYQAGNIMEDVHFHGGRYGVVTEKTSPAWQFTLIDSTFDGQRDAAIREHEVDLTLVNVAIKNTPVGIEIDRGYSDSLWGKNVRFENVSKAGVVISAEDNVFTQVGFENAIASNTPVFARFRDSAKIVAGKGRAYKVASFTYGLTLPGLGKMGEYKTQVDLTPLSALPAASAPALRALPPVAEWTNVKTLGVKGDGVTDDTAALQKAIDSHRVLYLPIGFYTVTDTLKLRPDTVLIGLHPAVTQLVIPDNNPGHANVGPVKPVLETPKGGDNILFGLGIFTGRVNPRASALLWRSGATSQVTDLKIMGGGGTPTADGKSLGAAQARSGDPVADGRWDAQYPSIWVTDGGGGTFANVWSPNTFASAGFYISDTSTPGHIYEVSVEHHVRNEFVLDNVQNWEFLAPQTEQEVGDGPDAVSLEVRNSRNILFANYHGYRVTRSYHPAETAVKLFNSSDIRFRNVHINAESGVALCDTIGCGTYLRASKYPFENAIQDKTRKQEVREREFAVLDVTGQPTPAAPASDGKARKLETGFWSISGATVGADGALYFIEKRFQRIYRWTQAKGLEVVRDHSLDPTNLAIDRSGKLLVVSSYGPQASVYSIDPAGPKDQLTMIAPTPSAQRPGAKTLLPVNWWNNGEFRDQYDPATDHFTTLAEMFARDVGTPKAQEYVSPDGSVSLPAFRVWQQGPPDHVGWRWADSLQANGLISGAVGERVFVTNGSENKTYSGQIGPGGTLTDLKVFANRGGESVAVDRQGRVFVANGQIFQYGPDGQLVGRIDVPERPLQLIFGGEDKKTLFVLTHHSLYAVTP
ncbi:MULTISPECIES: glycosyl hydrolase family 28-related protein [unclassified Caulobacter]|uniref:glycosyl hydrolase family 28-related protein n=1 Tax=unclassified Caulobacter TaxID=2648921 RepID=UPI0006F1D4A5|nr:MULTISPECIES: glycosyl hydrolase family 28-related protein [unclassified Caulobacter]KQV56902.1 gluconolaconase [Caulobacter sp. Root342]KQV72541.1 gluconolaconase [Caulobacter sp. Root343]